LTPLVVTVPLAAVFVRERLARESLLVLVEYVSENFPDESVKFPDVIVSFPEVRVRFLPDAIVVSPFRDIAPVRLS